MIVFRHYSNTKLRLFIPRGFNYSPLLGWISPKHLWWSTLKTCTYIHLNPRPVLPHRCRLKYRPLTPFPFPTVRKQHSVRLFLVLNSWSNLYCSFTANLSLCSARIYHLFSAAYSHDHTHNGGRWMLHIRSSVHVVVGLGKSYIMNPVDETTLVAQSVVLLVPLTAFASWNKEITSITPMCNKLNCIARVS